MKKIPFVLLFILLATACYANPFMATVVQQQTCIATETPEASCADSIDNDCDGLVDGADSDCGSVCSGYYGLETQAANQQATIYQMIINKVTLDCDGTPSTLEQYLNTADTDAREIKFIIYDDDGGTGEPGTRLYVSAAMYNATWNSAQWIADASVGSVGSLAAGDYYIGVIFESTSTTIFYTLASGTARVITNADFIPPASWNTGADLHSTAQRMCRIGF